MKLIRFDIPTLRFHVAFDGDMAEAYIRQAEFKFIGNNNRNFGCKFDYLSEELQNEFISTIEKIEKYISDIIEKE